MWHIPDWLIKLFKFLYKGGKIEATLIPAGGRRTPLREYPKPGAKGVGYGVVMYEASDMTRD